MLQRRFFLRQAIGIIVVLTVLTSLHAEGSKTLKEAGSRFTYTSPLLATCLPPCVENFDNVAAPTLPSGWTTTLQTGQPGDLPWSTVNAAFQSFPNSAFANGPNHATDNRLNSPALTIGSSGAVMTFHIKYNLESRFDGAVLEISIPSVAGGAFQDIITAGGSFIIGGYSSAIHASSSSPLAGRSAWSGDTLGGRFEDTVVKLPTSANGRSVTLRWRVVTDFSVSSGGAFVDSISLTDPPANDNFRDAQPLTLGTSGVINGTNLGATKEAGEPNHAGDAGGASVWYRWTAPITDRFTFTTFHSNFDTLLAVYTGDNLPGAPVASNNNVPHEDGSPCVGRYSTVSFNAIAGVVYRIAVDRDSSDTPGDIVLRWGRSASISGKITNAGGSGISVLIIRLEGDTCRDNESSLFDGSFTFTDVPTGGSYSLFFRVPSENYTRWGTSDSISPLTGNVSDFNYYRQTPAGNIVGTVKMPSDDQSGLAVTCVSTPLPLVSASGFFLGAGKYQCPSLPVSTNYVVTPAKLGFTFDPVSRIVTFFDSNGILGVDFTGTQAPPRTISGRVTTPNGTTGIGGVSIALSGSQTGSKVTDANGNYSFTGVLQGGNYTVTASNTNLAFAPPSWTFNNLAADQSGNFTATFLLQLILDESGQVAALDSVLLVRDPFPVVNRSNLLNSGGDRNTRVAIFVSNFALAPGELPSSVVINLIGSNTQSYDIPAEDVRPLFGFPFTRITFRLPDSLTAGTCTLAVKAHGVTSNLGAMTIRN